MATYNPGSTHILNMGTKIQYNIMCFLIEGRLGDEAGHHYRKPEARESNTVLPGSFLHESDFYKNVDQST